MDAIGTARTLGVGGLLAVAAVHANWARGSAWPLADRRRLAWTVYGSEVMPSALHRFSPALRPPGGLALAPHRAPPS